MYIDSHAHINFAEFKDEIPEVIKRAHDENTWVINVGSTFKTSEKSVEIAEQYDKGVYAVIGCHPIHLTEDITEKATFENKEYSFTTKKQTIDFQAFKTLAKSSNKVVGIGETGLDYYYLTHENKQEAIEIQKSTFKGFIGLAQKLKLPLVLHCRGSKQDPYGAYDDMLAILKEDNYLKGVIHCYGGNKEQAKEFLDLGFYIGFTGIVTFKNATELQDIAKLVPIDRLLIETDAPFLAPDPHRGKRNEPAFVKHIAEKIAELKDIPVSEVESQTFKNTCELFNIKMADRPNQS